jgi:hypothetical protein
MEGLLVSFRTGIGNLIPKNDIDAVDLALTLSIIKFAIDSGVFSRDISIFLEEALDAGGALIDAAAGSYVGFHLLLVVLYGSHLADYYLAFGTQEKQTIVETSDEGLHFVFYAATTVVLRRFVLGVVGHTMKEAGKLSPVLNEKGKEYCPAGMKLPPKL